MSGQITSEWTDRFIVVRAEEAWYSALHKLEATNAEWMLIRYPYGDRWHLLSRVEAMRMLRGRLSANSDDRLATVIAANNYGTPKSVRKRGHDSSSVAVPMGKGRVLWLKGAQPVAVGKAKIQPVTDARYSEFVTRDGLVIPPQPDDEDGTMPARFPSIETDTALAPGQAVVLTVDLKRKPDASTLGAVAFFPSDHDWAELPVTAVVQSHAIEFDNGGACTLLVRRNADTVAARVTGRLRADLALGSEIELKATFLLGTRYCGEAVRRMTIEPHPRVAVAAQLASAMQMDWKAPRPDLTIFITVFEADAPGKLHWRMVTEPFDTCPAQMDGMVNLGHDPATQAAYWLAHLENLERGRHMEQIAIFGEALWQRAPREFHTLYWALHDYHVGKPLTIQIVSDDPHVPWELMVPMRPGEANHGAIALRHVVARWIARLQGYMPGQLPAGDLIAIAPHYQSVNLAAPTAQVSVDKLVKRFGAQRIAGTAAALSGLLQRPPSSPVALVYFAGHGKFVGKIAQASSILLEDGELTAGEVGRENVVLGERYRTVFFLNACEVGGAANVFGSVGGWAHALLSRRFGGFIAPVWAVDAADANDAASEVMQLIVDQNLPIAEALQALRKKRGHLSPTFHSYLFYGDVTARLGDINARPALPGHSGVIRIDGVD
jgi:hypothetical protein